MPMRYLKPEVRDSATIDSLGEGAEVLWYRLLVTVDDFGRLDARPELVRSLCYPVKQNMTPAKVDALLRELDEKGAVVVYEAGGHRFLQMLRWTNVPRATKSKWPAFTDNCARVYARSLQLQAVPPPAEPERSAPAAGLEGFDRFWAAWPKSQRKGAKGKCAAVWIKGGLRKSLEQILAHVETMKASDDWQKENGKFVPAPLVYLNGMRWDGAEQQELQGAGAEWSAAL